MTINLKLDLYFVFRCTVYCCVSTLQQVVLEELVHRLHLTISWNASNLKHILIILKSVPSFYSSTLSYHSHLSAFLTLDSKLYQSVSCCVTDTQRKILHPYSGQKKKNLRSPLKLTQCISYFIPVKVHNPFVFAEGLHRGHNLFLFFCPKASVTGQWTRTQLDTRTAASHRPPQWYTAKLVIYTVSITLWHKNVHFLPLQTTFLLSEIHRF